ncbi:MAG: hypothetical protein V7699_00510 [Porticoccus sp.]
MTQVLHVLMCGLLGMLLSTFSLAAPSTAIPRVSDISSTNHNLSVSGPGTVTATSESQICVFCHTPHAANQDPLAMGIKAPLWNRALSTQTYTAYNSTSTQANIDANPGGSSKLCLSCHDGTLSMSTVDVIDGTENQLIDMSGARLASFKMPGGAAVRYTGFTRRLGTVLENDHPISFGFDTSKIGGRLAAADGELRDPQDPEGSHIREPSPGDSRPPIPLDAGGKVQCTSCHDPHISGQDLPLGTSMDPSKIDDSNIKFLRGRRFQMETPLGGNYDQSDDIVCLACHKKGGQIWSDSVHAEPFAANEAYEDTDADLREFPRGIKVWQAACLNCHDTHTVEGARRLLREGTDSTASPKSGGNSAIEETCYQCHQNVSTSILQATSNDVPDIMTDFTAAGNKHMPITTTQQPAVTEVHDIQDADFTETQENLGAGIATNLDNRHVECTDCHNPHRILKNSRFDGIAGVTTQSTHEHETTTNHTNVASGALKGTFGVEPNYGSDNKFGTYNAMPTSFDEKFGTEGDQVTKEYQICLKCHSNYAYNDDGGPDDAAGNNPNGRPETAGLGLTSYSSTSTSAVAKAQTNSMRNFTNQAMEFQAPSSHRGEGISKGVDGGACGTGGPACRKSGKNYNSNNHRSWHPVMDITGRDATTRDMSASNFLAPWDNNIGNQTMYCTDCHGNDNSTSADVVPTATAPWGPHGSSNDFILKGFWDRSAGQADSNGMLCFKCHAKNTYRGTSNTKSGFNGNALGNNGHLFHRDIVGQIRCTFCHAGVPHGWKNKALLVNLDDIGPEVMCRTVDTLSANNNGYNIQVPGGGTCSVGSPIPAGSRVGVSVGGEDDQIGNDDVGYNNPPYYINARLRVSSWAASGNWNESNCYTKDAMRRDIGMCDTPGH